jgi:hypothetical protein
VNLVLVLTNFGFILLVFPKQLLVFSVFGYVHLLRLHSRVDSSLASLFQYIEFDHHFIIPLMGLVQFQNFGLELGLKAVDLVATIILIHTVELGVECIVLSSGI